MRVIGDAAEVTFIGFECVTFERVSSKAVGNVVVVGRNERVPIARGPEMRPRLYLPRDRRSSFSKCTKLSADTVFAAASAMRAQHMASSSAS